MFRDTLFKVICHSCIKNPSGIVSNYINAEPFFRNKHDKFEIRFTLFQTIDFFSLVNVFFGICGVDPSCLNVTCSLTKSGTTSSMRRYVPDWRSLESEKSLFAKVVRDDKPHGACHPAPP